MASTNKTANLGLSQWEQSDAFNREDLNEDFRKIEEAFGKRLELKLLRDIDQPAQAVQLIEFDVSDVDFSEFMCFILDFQEFQTCSLLFNSTRVADLENETQLHFFPLKNGEGRAPFIKLKGNPASGRSDIRTSDIRKICMSTSSSMNFNCHGVLKIWGVG